MEIFLNILSWACLFSGAFFIFTSAVGILRMPDFFTRLHPAGMTDSLGLPLILIGLLFQSDFGLISLKILILIIFAVTTSATSCHALAKAALVSDIKPEGTIEKKPTKKTASKKATAKKSEGAK